MALYLRNMWFIEPISVLQQSQLRRFARIRGLVLALCLGLISAVNGQGKQLSFDRIVLEIPQNQIDTFNTLQKKCIDSIFGMATVDLMEFERILGYKLSGQLHLRLMHSAAEYQVALQKHPIWLERYQSQYLAFSSNHFPVFIGTTFEQIRIQLRYIIAYHTLNEFLNGSSIRQKMTQSGYQHFPSWISQGFCAYWANGWNIRAKDEFDYFKNKGAFPSPNQIEPLSAQAFGRFIWSSWVKEFGSAAITNFWFVLKYTGQSASAIEFVVGESFPDWYDDWKQKNMADDHLESSSDLKIRTHKGKSPILDVVRLGENQHFLCKFYVPDQEVWAIETSNQSIAKKPSTYQYQQIHAKLIPEAIYYLTVPVHYCASNVEQKLLVLSTTGNSLFTLDSFGVVQHISAVDSLISVPQFQCGMDAIFQSWGFSHKMSFKDVMSGVVRPTASNAVYPRLGWTTVDPNNTTDFIDSRKEYFIERQKIGADKAMLSLIHLDGGNKETLWNDTLLEAEEAIGLTVESKDIISHIQSNDNQWFIHFSKITDSLLIRWKIPLYGGFANQLLERTKDRDKKIIELSFSNDQDIFRWIDVSSISANDIIEMKRKYVQTMIVAESNTPSDSNYTSPTPLTVDSWTYVSPFPKKNLTERRFHESHTIYNAGRYNMRNAKSAIGLDKGGISLSNEDPYDFPNVSNIDPNSLYNHPLTPELRFYLSNPRWGHTLKAGILSNLPMSRMAVRLDQKWQIGHWQIGHQYHHRSRDYYIRETTLFQNLGDQLRLEAVKKHFKYLDLGVAVAIQRDVQFQKVNGPFSVLKAQEKLGSKSFILFGKTSLYGRNPRQFYRAKYDIDGQIGAYRFSLADNTVDMGYHLQFRGAFRKQLKSWISMGYNFQLNASMGDRKTQFWIGGSEGWIDPKPWDSKHLGVIVAQDYYAYRRIGGYVRGFRLGERMGHSSVVTNLELTLSPYAAMHQNLSKSVLLQQLQLYGFWDVGTAFIGNGLGAAENPFNLVQLNTSNYRVDVFAQRNPWIVGTGFGVRSVVLKMPIRYEVAWGLKEGKILAPIQHVCMTWNF